MLDAHYPFYPTPFDTSDLSSAGGPSALALQSHQQAWLSDAAKSLNQLLNSQKKLQGWTLAQLIYYHDQLPSGIAADIWHQAQILYSHQLYFSSLSAAQQQPCQELKVAVARQFGSLEDLKQRIQAGADALTGSGFCYLTTNRRGKLRVITVPNHGTPLLARLVPILALDLWEHAFFDPFRQDKAAYLNWICTHLDWDRANRRYAARREFYDNLPI